MFERLTSFLGGGGRGASPIPSIKAMATSTPYESASTGRRAAGWTPPDVSANLATTSAPLIRTRCRDAVRNDAWARAIVETLTDDLIGWGIKPLSRAENEGFRQAVQRLWDSWAATADADGVLDLAGLEALAVKTMITDGECFIRLRARKAADGLPVPLQLQVLPAEICPAEHSTRTAEGTEIREGIEFSAIGKRVAYWFREAVPGEADAFKDATTLHRVPAEQVLHLFEPLRPGQRRGVSALAPALVRLRELDKYADATLLRLQLSSMFMGTVRAAASDSSLDVLTGQSRETIDGSAVLRLSPGTLQELSPGETLDFNDPPSPPSGFDVFIKHELRAAGAAVGVPIQAFTGDWTGENDRTARVVLNQYRRRIHRLLWSIVIPQFLRPLWAAWFKLAVLSPSLPKPSGRDAEGVVTFAPHAHAYTHPVQDVTATTAAIKAGLTSRAAAVSETGEDVELIDLQISQDNARADRLGLVLESDGRQSKAGA